MNESQRTRLASSPAQLIGLAVGTVVCVVVLIAALVRASDIFLILFLAVLFGVFLTRTSAWLSRKAGLTYAWCLGGVTSLLVLIGLIGLGCFAMQIEDQFAKASKHFDQAERKLHEITARYPTIRSVLVSTPLLGEFFSPQESPQQDAPAADKPSSSPDTDGSDQATSDPSTGSTAAKENVESESMIGQKALQSAAKQGFSVLAGVFQTTFGLLVNSMLIFFVGLFVAVAPQKYRDGIVVLFPPARRERTREVMNKMGDVLWRWLIGRFGTMLVTGVGAGALLAGLGVPLAFTLAVVTALLTFIPNIGGLTALALAVLFALPQGSSTIIMLIVGYIVLQLVESYVITPLIQQSQVSLPPALLIGFQVVMSVLFGFLGAAVASPLLAAAKVGIEEAYIKDVLEADE